MPDNLRFLLFVFTIAPLFPNLTAQSLFQLKSADPYTSRLLPRSLGVSPTGLIAVTGGADNRRAFAQMLDGNGAGKWSKTYGPTDHTHFDDFVFTPSGNIIALMNHPSGGAERINIYSLDTNGIVLWEKQWTVPGIEYQRLEAIEAVPGGYIAVGYANDTESSDGKGIILKIDESGTLLWHRIIETGVTLYMYDFCTDEAGNSYLPAQVYNSHHVTVFKFSPDGDLLWMRYLDVPGNDGGALLFPAPGADGDILLAGGYVDNTDVMQKFFGWAVNIDRESGNIRWSKKYQPGNESARFNKIIPLKNGHWLVSMSNPGPDSTCVFKAHLLELDAAGQVLWAKKYAARTIFDFVDLPGEQLLLLASWPDNDRTAMAIMKTDAKGFFPGCCSPDAVAVSVSDADVLQSEGTISIIQSLQLWAQGIYVYDYNLEISPLCDKKAEFKLPASSICAGAYLTGLNVKNHIECADYRWTIEGGIPAESHFLYLDSVQFCVPGSYNITLQIDPEKCNESQTEVLEVKNCGFFEPNAFTPNGDDVNDLFRLPVCSDVEDYSFYVYNRWGEPVFHSTIPNAAWDGTHNGQPLASDVYVWRMQYRAVENGQEAPVKRKGEVALLR